MIIPALSDLSAPPHDVTIVGSGHAGLYLAMALGKAGVRVLVVEQGPLDDPLNEGAGYYEIDASGIDYLPLGERLAAFGGTSGHWSGMSRPLAPAVFEERPYLACRGWPIPYEAFERHLDAAKKWLGHTYGPDDWAHDDPADGFLPGPSVGLAAHQFAAGRPVRRLGAELRSRVETSDTVDLLPSHRVIDITLDPSGRRASSMQVVGTDSGIGGPVPVRQAVLATGGIENARLMLSAGRTLPAENPLTGRYNRTGATFMEHPKYIGLDIHIDDGFPLADTAWQVVHERIIQLRGYSLEENLFKKYQLPRFAVFWWGQADVPAQAADTVRRLDHTVVGREKTYRLCRPEFEFEQLPRDDSFIALSEKMDRHGQPLARMHWTITEDEMRAYWKSFHVFASLMSQCGAVRARLRHATFEDFAEREKVSIQHHHMGSTAMSPDDRTGVVDTNCTVHGLDNLHIAGSSVFPTGDYVNPTLNLLALADRLAHHLIDLTR